MARAYLIVSHADNSEYGHDIRQAAPLSQSSSEETAIVIQGIHLSRVNSRKLDRQRMIQSGLALMADQKRNPRKTYQQVESSTKTGGKTTVSFRPCLAGN
jgi:hypothetical protein